MGSLGWKSGLKGRPVFGHPMNSITAQKREIFMWQIIVIAIIVLLAGVSVGRTFWSSWHKARQGQPECPGCCQGCSHLTTLEPMTSENGAQPDCSQCDLKEQCDPSRGQE